MTLSIVSSVAAPIPSSAAAFRLSPTLLLLTHAPSHPLAAEGLQFAQRFCEDWQAQSDEPIPLSIFCYSEAAAIANRLIWLPADMPNVAKDWQDLVKTQQLTAHVCVSTALARGVVDADNAARHNLAGENLAEGFALVGLGELAMQLHQQPQVLQF